MSDLKRKHSVMESQSDSSLLDVDATPRRQLSTPSLDAIQTSEQKKVLNIVDSLRQCGLDGIVSLPQLVVCGDQSSGKSSVLEALTEIPFPRKETLCTRFATEIVMRRAPISLLEVKIIADPTKSAATRQKLEEFKMTISDFNELPNLIDQATNVMGLGENTAGIHAFSKDFLRIEITGPGKSPLTLVDLPGLIHSETKLQSKEDVRLVSELVQRYIENPRTIILAVVSAKNDYANQVVLKRAREVDPEGVRTLGTITKPDDLAAGSDNESAFIDLAKNKDIFFSLGWHCVRNRGYPEKDFSFSERNELEKSFFSKGKWLELDPSSLGIDSLRSRLSILLFQHIKQELPKLKEDLNGKYEQTCLILKQLGMKREDEPQQREFLMTVSLQFNDVTKAAVNGHYEGPFFGREHIVSNIGDSLTVHSRRLRAVIQHHNMEFAQTMRKSGHKYSFEGLVSVDDDDELVPKSGSSELPKSLSLEEALNWALKVLRRTRGVELFGNFNPLVVGELFWELSEGWADIAEEHVEKMFELCKNFVDDLLKEICPPDIHSRLRLMSIEQALQERFEGAEGELNKIIADNKRHPATWNHYFTTNVTRMRLRTEEELLQKALDAATTRTNVSLGLHQPAPFVFGGPSSPLGPQTVEKIAIDTAQAVRNFHGAVEQDMENHSCKDALIDVRAYYKVALKTFIDNVNTQVVERHIIQGLEKVFSPMTVGTWSAEEISELASEPSAIARQRENLESRQAAIKNGLKIFSSVMRRG